MDGTSMSSKGRSAEAERRVTARIRDDLKMSTRIRVHFMNLLKCMVMQCAVDPDGDPTKTLEKVVEATTRVYNSDLFVEGRANLDSYCERTKENEGSPFLTKCFNRAFELLGMVDIPELKEKNFSDLVFLDNAGKTMDHYYRFTDKGSDPKPDLCIVTKRLLWSMQNHGIEKLIWPDILGVAELKNQGNVGIPKQRGGAYPVVLPTEVKECRVLPDRKIERGALCASQTFGVENSEDPLTHPDDRQDDEWESGTLGYMYTKVQPRSKKESNGPTDQSIADRVKQQRGCTGSPSETNSSPIHGNHYTELPDLLPNEQITMHGLEMLCRGFYTLHTVNLLIIDDVVWVWWYDRQNVIQTTGLNFVQYMPYFMVLLALFQRFSLEQWGVEPSLVNERTKFIIPGSSVGPEDPVYIELENIMVRVEHPPEGLYHLGYPVQKGQATSLSTTCTELGPEERDLNLQVSWPEAHDVSLIEQAYNALRGRNATRYLPSRIGVRDFPSSLTSKIIEQLMKMNWGTYPRRSPRILEIHLFIPVRPIDEVEDEYAFTKAWVDCLECHYELWKEGFQFCDIDVSSLAYDEFTNRGVLNSFALPVALERTGTLHFMSRRMISSLHLTEKTERWYQDDLESFIWVFAWLCLRGVQTSGHELWDWRGTSRIDEIIGRKRIFLRFFKYITPPECYLNAPRHPLNAWTRCGLLMELLDILGDCNAKRARYNVPGPLPQELVDLTYREVLEIVTDSGYNKSCLVDFESKLYKVVDQEVSSKIASCVEIYID